MRNGHYFLRFAISTYTGPRGLPIFGYAPFILSHDSSGFAYKALVNLSKIYGPVAGFIFGLSRCYVSICGYDAVKEALCNSAFDGRLDTEMIRFLYNDNFGIVYNPSNIRQRSGGGGFFSISYHFLNTFYCLSRTTLLGR